MTDNFIYLRHYKYPTVVNKQNIEYVRDVGNAIWIHFTSGAIHKMHKDDIDFETVLENLDLSYLIEEQ